MKYLRAIGWGVVMYAVIFLLFSIFATHGFTQGLAPRIVSLVILIGVALIAGSALRYHSWVDILPYSILWAVMMGIFDALTVVPYTGWALYFDWNLWFGYAVVVIAPLFAPYLRLERFSTQSPERL